MTDNRKPRTLEEYLEDMQKSVNRLMEISRVDGSVFKDNEDKQDAAIRHIQILGEISSKLLKHYPAFTADNKDIPFRKISDMRKQLIHGYFGVSLDAVWEVLKINIPALDSQLSTVVVTSKNSIQKGRGVKI
ncbi:HepT-like ribonuclease domain-containing protein [Geomonas agri]|uniref:HepT-like ribonuclease domain-containing protein n=1 Tax=Geomonas agri TaxID=2873702 RepID=UPI001CD1EFB9|nr:HepT-like ribonuclease domain-containing protein [Geomonas agri]